jgi:hypothetical protein
MDHDRLTFPDSGEGRPLAIGRALDERYVLGAFAHLAEIYHVDGDLARRGREAMLAELPRARRRVRRAGLPVVTERRELA